MVRLRGGVKVDGIPQLQYKFTQLPNRVAAHVLHKSLNAAGGEFKRGGEAKAATEVNVITGALKKSIRVKMARKKFKDTRCVVIGPSKRTLFLRKSERGNKMVWQRFKGNALERDMARARYETDHVPLVRINPGKYGHLVEFGHGGPRPAPPHPFMRLAFRSRLGAAKRAFTKQFFVGLKREIKKLKGKR